MPLARSAGGSAASKVCVWRTSTFIGNDCTAVTKLRAGSSRRTWYWRRCAGERPDSAGVSPPKKLATSSTYVALSFPKASIGKAARMGPTLLLATEIAIGSESSATASNAMRSQDHAIALPLPAHQALFERRPRREESAEVGGHAGDAGHEQEVASEQGVGDLEEPPILHAVHRDAARVGDCAVRDDLRIRAGAPPRLRCPSFGGLRLLLRGRGGSGILRPTGARR